jgi:hypothetical protein
MLQAPQISEAIRRHLAGGMTLSELAGWAHEQFMKEDAGDWFDPRDSDRIREAIQRLMVMGEGEQFELERAQLEALAKSLDRPR